MNATVINFPRAATWHRFATPQGSIYDQAYEAVKTATDWPTRLGYAETLAQSPDWTHASLARHIRTAYSLHLAGLLHPVDPTHRDRSDRVDAWREATKLAEEEDTSARIAMRHSRPLLAWLTGVLCACLAAVAFGAVL
jgi:hypothetical protein